MSRLGLFWGQGFHSRSDVGEPGHAFEAVEFKHLKKADVFTKL